MAELSFHTSIPFMGAPMDLSLITSAISGAQTAVELVKTAVSARDQAKAEEAVADTKKNLAIAYDSLLSVSQEAMKLVQQVMTEKEVSQTLREEVKRLTAEIEDRKRYVLTNIGGGVLAYAFKPTDGEADVAHYLCQPCMTKGHKSVLQPHGPRSNFKCHACNAVYLADQASYQIAARARGRGF